jgi:LysM repeat protein
MRIFSGSQAMYLLQLLSITPALANTATDVEAIFPVEPYVNQFQDIAIAEMERTGIPASIKLAQAVLESDYGRSMLAREANNHFGIKCGGDWSGETIYKQDDETKPSCFRKYGSADESYIAHSDFLTDPRKSARYGGLFKLSPYDYRGWAEGLEQAGYATSREYAEKLIALIERHNLQRFDQTSAALAGTNNEGGFRPVVTKPRTETSSNSQGGASAKTTVYKRHGQAYILALPGDTPERIAERMGLDARRLARFNETQVGVTFKPGQRVWLQHKKRRYKGAERSHKLQSGETLYDVSQTYGLTLSALLKINGIDAGERLEAGTRIKIK